MSRFCSFSFNPPYLVPSSRLEGAGIFLDSLFVVYEGLGQKGMNSRALQAKQHFVRM